MSESDAELLARWRSGDGSAGRELAERYYRSLHRFFRAKGIESANDLIQDTLLACLESADAIRGESVRAFVFGIARRRLFRMLALRYRHVEDVSERSLVDLGMSPSEARLKREEHRLVLRALRRLRLDDQVILELYYWEGLTAPDLSAALGVPVGTVRSRLRLAKERFEGEVHSVAREGRHLESTVDDLEAWARSLADVELGPAGEDEA